ncbi:MAG TPA: mersacidin/lichenicidin family type 2 lantibiotic [Candidatus Eremiobacteraceae bacterium]|nr:mersacidin/lichenicidin family type 2 lantibiotic [Candidatus Eremiobacteraceae bacterium]
MSEEKKSQVPANPAGQLSDQELDKVVGGDSTTPKEEVAFEYGALQVKYVQQDTTGEVQK